jgi:hypothetical protein
MTADKDKHFLSEYSKYLDSAAEHLTYTALSTFVNFRGEMSAKERKFIRDHLEGCTSCSARLREVEEVESDTLSSAPQTTLWWTSPAFRYSIAAVFVLAMGTAIALYVFRGQPEDHVAAPSPSPNQTMAALELDPERFAVNATLENFIERAVRSAREAAFVFPGNGDTVHVPFLVRWTGAKGKFTLTLVDNKNREVSRVSTSGQETTIDLPVRAGLYYLKLEADNVLADVRRVIALAER